MSAAKAPAKKTIYIDVDEEITGIIDKVRSANESIVALVLPKRATMLQSPVNMKLLKRASNQADKKVVLITSESTLMPLAGAAGLFVAANLQSRPYIPSEPSASERPPIGPEADDEEPEIDPETPIGKLMSDKGKKSSSSAASSSDPIEIDNTPKTDADDKAAAAGAAAAAKKAKKEKSKKVPDFNKFRVLLIGGAALIIFLIVFGWWALAVAPKATVTLRTESSEADVNADFIANTKANEVNLDNNTVPAESKEVKKTQSEKVPATGEIDNGTKASGQVTLRNCTDDDINIPAGTGVSNGGFTFITQASVRLDDNDQDNGCETNGDNVKSVNVIAQKNGDQYNLGPRTYTVSGFNSIVANGDQMSGGTSKITKTVSAADVEKAKKQIADKQNAVVEEIKNEMKDQGYIALIDTFSSGNPAYTVTPAVGAEASEVTVSGEVTYTMVGVKEDELEKLLDDKAKEKDIDTSKQAILDYGFDDATFEIGDKKLNTTEVNIKTKLVAGPDINQDELKKELAGKKKGDVESMLKGRPGITNATAEFSPFWVSKVPGNPDKVTIKIEQADGTPIEP